MNPMQVWIEIYPFAADEQGVWLVSGSDPAWEPRLPVMADTHPLDDAKAELAARGVAAEDVTFLHGTSWHVDGPRHVDTIVAVLHRPGYVRKHWPAAEPVDLALADAVGQPDTHGATEVPSLREIDVAFHALRHLALLLKYDATAAAVLDEHWRRHLAGLTPALAGMYSEIHRAA